MHLFIARRDVLEFRDHRLELFFRVFELRRRLYDFLQRSELLLWLARIVKSRDQFIRLRHAFRAHLDRVGFLRRNRKHAARFHLFSGGVPPAFPFHVGKEVGDHPFANLLSGCSSLKAFQNVSHDCHRVVFGELLHRG